MQVYEVSMQVVDAATVGVEKVDNRIVAIASVNTCKH